MILKPLKLKLKEKALEMVTLSVQLYISPMC